MTLLPLATLATIGALTVAALAGTPADAAHPTPLHVVNTWRHGGVHDLWSDGNETVLPTRRILFRDCGRDYQDRLSRSMCKAEWVGEERQITVRIRAFKFGGKS